MDSYLLGTTEAYVVEGGITETYALRFAGFEEDIGPSTTWALNTAGSWDEFREALRGWHCPGQNAVYAGCSSRVRADAGSNDPAPVTGGGGRGGHGVGRPQPATSPLIVSAADVSASCGSLSPKITDSDHT